MNEAGPQRDRNRKEMDEKYNIQQYSNEAKVTHVAHKPYEPHELIPIRLFYLFCLICLIRSLNSSFVFDFSCVNNLC